jgi:hypothetical protein
VQTMGCYSLISWCYMSPKYFALTHNETLRTVKTLSRTSPLKLSTADQRHSWPSCHLYDDVVFGAAITSVKYYGSVTVHSLPLFLGLSNSITLLIFKLLFICSPSGGPGSIPGTTRKKKVVRLERGPLSLVSTTEELLDRKVAAPV